MNKYYFDWVNENVIASGARRLGGSAWRFGDQGLIDGALVNGSARSVALFSRVLQHLQTGYLYHYAFAMIIGLVVLVGWLVFGV